MQTSANSSAKSFQELFTAIIMGLMVGAITTLFIRCLELIEIEQLILNSETWPLHVFFIPVVLTFLYLLKKQTLYFPLKVSELTSWKLDTMVHWNPLMSVFHFFGTLMSHMVGASVGREGSVVVMAAGLVRAFRLDWKTWGPIAIGCGFSAIIGQPWIGLIFMSELLKTNFRQKLYVLISSLFASLLMQTFQVRHLIAPIELNHQLSFWNKLLLILTLAFSCGFLMRFYKWIHFWLTEKMQTKSFYIRLVFSFVLVGLLLQPDFRRYQSLGLLQIEDIKSLQLGFQIPLMKLLLTLLSVCVGFWGGEFIPLVYSGLHFGATMANSLGFDSLVGAYLTAYLFFAGATRLKWTSFFLIFALLGFSWVAWILLLVNLTIGFSGSGSMYQSDE